MSDKAFLMLKLDSKWSMIEKEQNVVRKFERTSIRFPYHCRCYFFYITDPPNHYKWFVSCNICISKGVFKHV